MNDGRVNLSSFLREVKASVKEKVRKERRRGEEKRRDKRKHIIFSPFFHFLLSQAVLEANVE
jgi:hypothetical protein